MIKRNDLAKQFELIVQQEVKNHNNAILSSNVRFNNLEKKLSLEILNLSRQFSHLDAAIGKIKSEHQDIFEGHKKFSEKVASSIRDLDNAIIALRTKFLDFCSSQAGKYCLKKDLSSHYQSIEEKLKSLSTVISDLKKDLDWTTKYLQTQVTTLIERFREELKLRPSEIDMLEKTLISRIESHRVDNEGILRELKHCKRANHINEKKIEHLYMLIEKLSPKGDS